MDRTAPSPQPTRPDADGSVFDLVLPVVGLAGLAVAQPLLDVFGRNPEFFVAADLSTPQILAFASVIAFGVPVVLSALVLAVSRAVGPTGARIVGESAIGAVTFMFGALVAAQLGLDRTIQAVALGATLACVLLLLRRRFDGFRRGLRYLWPVPVACLALFVFASRTSDLLFDGDAALATDVVIENPAPIVVVVLDEVPLASLVTAGGTINAERFPNFARLASASTWYRNATSVAPATSFSVPIVLDGDVPPKGSLPRSADHPESLFTLLGATYDMRVMESVTDLCPADACTSAIGDGPETGDLSGALRDALLVYGHSTLPLRFRSQLPAIDQTWGDFGQDPVEMVSEPEQDTDETTNEFMQRIAGEKKADRPTVRGESLRASLDRLPTGDRQLLFTHEVFPHFPWVRTPTGGVYTARGSPAGLVDADGGGAWDADSEAFVALAQQRHLLQLGYADRIVGDLIDRMEASRTWDDAVVVVTADHGIAFEPGVAWRAPTEDNAQAVYRVPLFIKLPGHGPGDVDDEVARTMDILPTIVDALGIETDFEFGGVSLLEGPRASEHAVYYAIGPRTIPGGFEQVIQIAERNAERFPHGDDWRSVYGPGPNGDLVGRELSELDVSTTSGKWSVEGADSLDRSEAGSPTPIYFECSLDVPGERFVVALNGIIAGVVALGNDPDCVFLLDESLLVEGLNEVRLIGVDGVGDSRVLTDFGPPG